ncbi:sulfate ABC transporter permease [Nocardioides sp.]|uniref:sulfate ABC transporter permease n=1 Tax=Nocardioides sp. TaxID=35761 RepID=UPI0035132667
MADLIQKPDTRSRDPHATPTPTRRSPVARVRQRWARLVALLALLRRDPAEAGRLFVAWVRRNAMRWLLRYLALGYVFFLVAWPVALVVKEAFADGVSGMLSIFGDEQVVHALTLTAQVAVQAVIINLVFGVTISLLLVRYRFPGKRLLSALIDVPLSVSPVVVGLSLLLVYNGRDGFFGTWLEENGVQIIFSGPGIIMATCFVALPLVIREVVPVLQEIGDEQEQAARSLGASGRQTFWRITLPSIKWAVVYGVVLSLARSLGEFGAVKVVSGNYLNQTQTATLVVEEQYQSFEKASAYSVSFVLAFVSVLCIVVVSFLRPKEHS